MMGHRQVCYWSQVCHHVTQNKVQEKVQHSIVAVLSPSTVGLKTKATSRSGQLVIKEIIH